MPFCHRVGALEGPGSLSGKKPPQSLRLLPLLPALLSTLCVDTLGSQTEPHHTGTTQGEEP